MSEIENGPTNNWWNDPEYSNGSFDHIGWFNRYLKPYVKTVKAGKIKGLNNNFVIFDDGSALEFRHWAQVSDINFYPGNPDKCLKIPYEYQRNGRCSFTFLKEENKGYEPYVFEWDGKEESLYTQPIYGCNKNSESNFYCTKILQMNNWEIPDNYPYKVSY